MTTSVNQQEFVDILTRLGFFREGKYLIRAFRVRNRQDGRIYSGKIRIDPENIEGWSSPHIPDFYLHWDNDPQWSAWHGVCWQSVPKVSTWFEVAWAVRAWCSWFSNNEEC